MFNLAANETGQDFTAVSSALTISGTVYSGGAGLSGATLTLTGSNSATLVTDASGTYSFTVAEGGSYTLAPSKTGYSFTPASKSWANLSESQAQNFAAEAALPAAPALVSPAYQAENVSANLHLIWNPVANAASYDAQLATDAAFTQMTRQESGLAQTAWPAANLAPYTVYYWRARALNGAGASPWSDVWRFTTALGDLAARIESPAADTAIFKGENVYFRGNECPLTASAEYQWFFGDGRTAAGREPGAMTFNQTGTIAVQYLYRISGTSHASDVAMRLITVRDRPAAERLYFIVQPYHTLYSENAWLSWQTNLSAAAIVRYGTSPANLDREQRVETVAAEHNVILSGLTANTTWYYQAEAIRGADTARSLIDSFFIEQATADHTPPYVIDKQIYMYNTSGFLIFTLSEPAQAILFYGTDKNSLSQYVQSLNHQQEHSFFLENLLPETAYYYRLMMVDPSGNTGYYPPANQLARGAGGASDFSGQEDDDDGFSTTNQPDTRPPAIGAEVFLHADGKLGIIWSYDEPAVYRLELYRGTESAGVFADTATWRVGHYLIIEGLENSAEYRARLWARDVNGNEAMTELSARIEGAAPATPPVVSVIRHELVNGELRVQWLTDAPATAELRWGRAQGALDHTLVKKTLNSEHTMILNNVATDQPLWYQVRSCAADGETCAEWSDAASYSPTAVEETDAAAKGAPGRLECRVWPNPFNDWVSIGYRLPETGAARVEIYDVMGRLLRVWEESSQPVGEYVRRWDGRDADGQPAPTGVYFCRVVTPRETAAVKLLLMK